MDLNELVSLCRHHEIPQKKIPLIDEFAVSFIADLILSIRIAVLFLFLVPKKNLCSRSGRVKVSTRLG